MSGEPPPPIRGIVETAVFSDDLARARGFYGDVLGLECVLDAARMLTYAVAPAQVLLVFKRGATREDSVTPEGTIPATIQRDRPTSPSRLTLPITRPGRRT